VGVPELVVVGVPELVVVGVPEVEVGIEAVPFSWYISNLSPAPQYS
jgi:hypothetical protein